MREIVAEAWESVLRPLVYREALDLAASARGARRAACTSSRRRCRRRSRKSRGSSGFAGAIASRAEVEDGVYTGRLERRLYGQAKADALAELAGDEALDLPASTAYSDSHSTCRSSKPSVTRSRSIADRELRRVASARGWPDASLQDDGVSQAMTSSEARSAPGGSRARAGCGRRARRPLRGRRAAREARARPLAGRLARVARARSCRSSAPARIGRGIRALGRARCARLSRARGDRARDPRRPAGARARGGRQALLSRRGARLLGAATRRRRARRRRSPQRRLVVWRIRTAASRSLGRTLSRSRSRRATARRSSRTPRWVR